MIGKEYPDESDGIDKALESLYDERVLDAIEVLIIDDGSKDGTKDIALRYQEMAPATFHYIPKENGGHIILLVHDTRSLYKHTWQSKFFSAEEFDLYRISRHIIVHNDHMKQVFEDAGIEKNKLITLRAFDYITDKYNMALNEKNKGKDLPIIIAGNLSPWKAAYIRQLSTECKFNLYGIGYEEPRQANIQYFGALYTDDLPNRMIGSYGSVWDGESVETCAGVTGEYLRINNPHKTSLYLACGFPVIIWREAVMANFILENQCGFVVDSLREIATKIAHMTKSDYDKLKENAEIVGEKIRNGCFQKNCDLSM